MAVYIYRSTDSSAPIMNGTSGSLINVLDACLVNGYDAKSPIGWTKPYSGTNIAVYKMNAGSQSYLAVDDTGTQIGRFRGFVSMTGVWSVTTNPVTVGSYPFPNEVQLAGGQYIYKSSTANATARPWVLISNGTMFYLWIDGQNDSVSTRSMAFGDIHSYNLYDINPCISIGSGNAHYNYFVGLNNLSTQADHFLASRYDGNGYSIPAGKYAISGLNQASYGNYPMGQANNAFCYPDPISGALFLSPVGVIEQGINGNIPRGRMPGLWSPCHGTPFNTGDTIIGAPGSLVAGRTFEAFRGGQYLASLSGCYLIETSDTQLTTNFR